MNYKTIHSTLLPILSNGRKIGIFCSGGFDSTLLLFICLSIIKEENLDTHLQVFTVPRHDDSIVHAQRVVDYMNRRFNISLSIRAVGDPDLEHYKQVSSGLGPALQYCDQILLGDTTNPEEVPNGPDRVRSMNEQFVQPFMDSTKRSTVMLSIEVDFIECQTLTHTCTESKTVRCGWCWQCRERAWAFDVNDLIDIGAM
jgi:hypothetical protein